MNLDMQFVLGALAIGVGLVLAFVQVNARRLGKNSPVNSGLPLYRFTWYRLVLALLSLAVGVLIIVDAMGTGPV